MNTHQILTAIRAARDALIRDHAVTLNESYTDTYTGAPVNAEHPNAVLTAHTCPTCEGSEFIALGFDLTAAELSDLHHDPEPTYTRVDTPDDTREHEYLSCNGCGALAHIPDGVTITNP